MTSRDTVDYLNPSKISPMKIELVNLAGKPRESQRRGGRHGKDGGGLACIEERVVSAAALSWNRNAARLLKPSTSEMLWLEVVKLSGRFTSLRFRRFS
jgi:hypothetical protein